MSAWLSGILVPIVTPCDRQENLKLDLLDSLADELLKKPVQGLYICGGTGDGGQLTLDERRQVSRLLLPKLKRARKTAIVHVGQVNLRAAVSLAEHAGSLGADAVAAIPPNGSWDAAGVYYRALAGTGLPVIIYYIPSLTGLRANFADIAALLEIPGVEGIKVSDWNVFMISQIKAAYPERRVFTGYDEMLLYGLACGADGIIGTWAQIFPGLYVRIFSLVQQGEWATAHALFKKFAAFLAECWKYGALPVFEALMSSRGTPRCFRQPTSWPAVSIPPEVLAALDTAAAELEAEAASW
ncbi:MAG: dihydrodipicolinate synthase family protein [Clostridiales bacterium]|jgi:dihydrodipicolinate synthase/N-acetylneuraminate lyase|nr:dihydrodipicolinate synthase family protein [Clostridiales bacterium]